MRKEKIKILAICSSPKRMSHTDHLLNQFIKAAKSYGAEVRRIELYHTKLRSVSGRLGLRLTRATPLQKAMLESDGFAIATPTYWFNEPGILKNFIDQLTILEESGFLLEGKVAGFIVYSPQGGESDVLENLALTFNHMGILLPPYSLIFYRGPQDRWVNDDLKRLAHNMIQQIQTGKQLGLKWDHLDPRYRVSPIELLKKKRFNKK